MMNKWIYDGFYALNFTTNYKKMHKNGQNRAKSDQIGFTFHNRYITLHTLFTHVHGPISQQNWVRSEGTRYIGIRKTCKQG